VIVSPFATQEEAKAALALAQALKATPQFVSPAPNGLKDDLLHTGDPCPNRRGLVEQGFTALEPAAALAALAAAPAAVLAGERVLELLGHEGLAKLPTKLRLVAFDVETSDIPALDVVFPVPTHVEKSGHWVNVDGHVGVLNVAVPPPSGVRRLDAQLAALAAKLAATPARS
jgi:NADH dehydrogenase/NADH:ubiquinone oxidoreductase subunit G